MESQLNDLSPRLTSYCCYICKAAGCRNFIFYSMKQPDVTAAEHGDWHIETMKHQLSTELNIVWSVPEGRMAIRFKQPLKLGGRQFRTFMTSQPASLMN